MIEIYEPFYFLMRMPFHCLMTDEEWMQLRNALPDSLDDVELNFFDNRIFPDADGQYQAALNKITPPSRRVLTTGQAILINVALSQSKKRVSESVRQMFSNNLFFLPVKCFDRCLRNYLMLVDKEECEKVLKDVQERVDSIKDDYKNRKL